MHIDPAAILALVAEQQARIMHLSQENEQLRQKLAQVPDDAKDR